MRTRTRLLPFNTGCRADLNRATDNDRHYPGEIIPPAYGSTMPPEQKWQLYGGGRDRVYMRFLRSMSYASQPVGAYEFAGYESIVDDPKGYGAFKNVQHIRVESFNLPYGCALRMYEDRFDVYPFYRDSTDRLDAPFAPKHAEGSSNAAARAWWTMQPRFEGNISMLNFLYELKDVKSMIKAGYDLMSKISAAGISRTINKFIRDHKVDVTKPVSEVYLTYTYGIAPLIADFKSIIQNLLATVDEAQKQFALRGENGNTSHYREVLASSDNTHRDRWPMWTTYGTCSSTVFHATLAYFYDYKVRDASSAFLKYWGLTGSAEALWNAVPFSFLVDYFIKVASALRTMDTDENVRMRDYHYCESLLTELSSGTYFTPGGYNEYAFLLDGVEGSYGAQTAGTRARRYDRVVTSPNKGIALPRLNQTSSKQYANMAALLRSFC